MTQIIVHASSAISTVVRCMRLTDRNVRRVILLPAQFSGAGKPVRAQFGFDFGATAHIRRPRPAPHTLPCGTARGAGRTGWRAVPLGVHTSVAATEGWAAGRHPVLGGPNASLPPCSTLLHHPHTTHLPAPHLIASAHVATSQGSKRTFHTTFHTFHPHFPTQSPTPTCSTTLSSRTLCISGRENGRSCSYCCLEYTRKQMPGPVRPARPFR